MKQKQIFLESEGDAWFQRNRDAVAIRKLPDEDPILLEISDIIAATPANRRKVLEIGCGDGSRLVWLRNNLQCECHGIDPSPRAIEAASAKGIYAQVGTADTLPFDGGSFDFIIFGFCLYLCDRTDLFRIASEADRVLRSPGWIVILDFYSAGASANAYHHRPGISSYKMDYSSLFSWHPDYRLMTHKIRHHGTSAYTDDTDEWMGLAVLRRTVRDADA